MKYFEPKLEIVQFQFKDILTESSIDDGNVVIIVVPGTENEGSP